MSERELSAREHVEESLRLAALESAPRDLWHFAKQVEEAAWLKGRDDTVEYIRDSLSPLPDSLTHATPQPPALDAEPNCESCDDTGIYEEGSEWAPCEECDLGRGFAERLRTFAREHRPALDAEDRERLGEIGHDFAAFAAKSSRREAHLAFLRNLASHQPQQERREERGGAELIAAERQRQVSEEGWTPGHDDTHDDHERSLDGDEGVPVYSALVRAAVCYAMPPIGYGWGEIPELWPWEPESWKPGEQQREIRRLTKAGALIAAEIDRLQRLDVPDA